MLESKTIHSNYKLIFNIEEVVDNIVPHGDIALLFNTHTYELYVSANIGLPNSKRE